MRSGRVRAHVEAEHHAEFARAAAQRATLTPRSAIAWRGVDVGAGYLEYKVLDAVATHTAPILGNVEISLYRQESPLARPTI